MWDHVRNMRLPDSLAHKIALFQANAAAPDTHDYNEEETRDAFIDLLLRYLLKEVARTA